MKPQRRVALACLVLAGSLAWCEETSAPGADPAENRQASWRVLSIDSPLYDLVDAMYREQGMTEANKARPWTVLEARRALDAIDRESLSPAGRSAWEESWKLLGWDHLPFAGSAAFGTGIELCPEAFYHINLDRDAAAADETYVWNHGYEERKSPLAIPLRFAFEDALFLETVVEVKEEYHSVTSGKKLDGTYPAGVADNHFNILFDDPKPFANIAFPFKALLSTGGSWWSLRFGRDDLSWGNGRTGNLLLSDYVDSWDFVGVELFSPNLKFSSVYIAMEPYDYQGLSGSYTSAFLAHRLDIRLWKRALLSLNEAISFCYDGTGATQTNLVHDLNTLMFFHNWNIPDRTNSLVEVEFSVNPWKYFDLYGQIAMDELTTAYEAAGDGGGGPPIFGFLAGATADLPIGPGYLSATGEWALTSPWLYNRVKQPYFYSVHSYWSLVADRDENLIKPIGYEYGADAVVWYLGFRYSIPGSWSLALDGTLSSKGEKGPLTAWAPLAGDRSPSGIAETRLVLHFGAELPLAAHLSFGTNLYAQNVANRDHLEGAYTRDMELSCYLSYKH